MEEDVTRRTVAISVQATKLTGRVLCKAFQKFLAEMQKQRRASLTPHGRQTVKQLIGQNQGVSTIESNDPEIKDFERIARKYGVDYAVKKVKTDGKTKYVIFFKARDADALTQAFTEYSRKTVEKEKKPSVLKKLRDLSAVVKGKVLERTKEKQRGQSR